MSPEPTSKDVLLRARNLRYQHPSSPDGTRFILDVPAIDVVRGSALALCGPSGSGKSTLLSILAGLKRPDKGEVTVYLEQQSDLYQVSPSQWRTLRRHFGIVHQDPREYLNDRRRTVDLVADPLHIHRLPGFDPGPSKTLLSRNRRAKATMVLQKLGITAEQAQETPDKLSGGQRQRVAIARALVTDPELIFFDEPTSALDVSVQAGIIQLLIGLRKNEECTFVFVTHELGLVRQLADKVAILDRGQIVEMNDTESVFQSPQAELTKRLLAPSGLIPKDPET